MEKVCIFVDGANFYHLVLKKLGIEEASFDFDKFATFLANGRTISSSYAYVAVIPMTIITEDENVK